MEKKKKAFLFLNSHLLIESLKKKYFKAVKLTLEPLRISLTTDNVFVFSVKLKLTKKKYMLNQMPSSFLESTVKCHCNYYMLFLFYNLLLFPVSSYELYITCLTYTHHLYFKNNNHSCFKK